MPLIKRRRVRPGNGAGSGVTAPLWRRAAKASSHLLTRSSSGNTGVGTTITIGSSSQSRGASSSVATRPPLSSTTATATVSPPPPGGEYGLDAASNINSNYNSRLNSDIAPTFTWSEFDDGTNPAHVGPPRRRFMTRPPSMDETEYSESLAGLIWRPTPPPPEPVRDRETSRRVIPRRWKALLKREALVDKVKRRDGTSTPTFASAGTSVAIPRSLSGNVNNNNNNNSRLFEEDRHERLFDDPIENDAPSLSLDLEPPSSSWEIESSPTLRSWRSVSSRSFQKRIEEPPKILAAIGRQVCMNDISHLVDAANSPCISYDRQIFDRTSQLWKYVEADPPSGSRWELGGPNSLGSPVTTRSVPGSVIATPSLPTPAAMHAAAAKWKKNPRREAAADARAIARRHLVMAHKNHNHGAQHHGHGLNHNHHNHNINHNLNITRRPWSPAPSRPRTPVRASSGTIPTRKLSTYSEDGNLMSSATPNRGSYARRTASNHNYLDGDYSYNYGSGNGGNGGRANRGHINNYDRRQFSNYSEDGSMLFSASASTAVANSSSQRHGQRQLSGFIR